MGEMAEYWADIREYRKEKRANNLEKYEPILSELGAVKKSEGVWEYTGWFIYPSKRFAMNKQNCKKRKNIDKFLKEYLKNG